MRLRTPLAALSLLAMGCGHADAQHVYGPFSDCHGTIGGSPGNVTFAAAPQDYLLIQNNSTSNQIIWVNVLPSGTATTAPPSIQLSPTASILFQSVSSPVPGAVSIIASASSAVYSCIYK